MELHTGIGSFIEAVRNGFGSLADFWGNSLFSPSPVALVASASAVGSEPDSNMETMDWEEIKFSSLENMWGDKSLVTNADKSAPASPGVPCAPTLKPVALPVQETQSFVHQLGGHVPLTSTANKVSQAVNRLYVSATGHYTAPAAPHVRNDPGPSSILCRNGEMKQPHALNENKPYIKKPLNAFMLFRAEQRLTVLEELSITDSAAVNRVVGERWRNLSAEIQVLYFEQLSD